MDLRAAPPTDTAAAPKPPAFAGAQPGPVLPGSTGGMPAKPGLSVTQNPMAQQLQSMGRGDDKMLVHMTPAEVGGLQQLAMASGGSLTVNPHTGLPEAGWLGKLLPTILGAIATPLTGGLINPLTASALVGAGTGIATGDIGKGLMAGLQAYGGAALGAGLGLNAGSFGIGQAADAAKVASTAATAAPAAGNALTNAGLNVPTSGALNVAATPFTPAMSISGLPGAASIAPAISTAGQSASAASTPGFFSKFSAAARQGLAPGSMISKAAPYAAGLGVLDAVNQASMPTMATPESENKSTYEGPYQFPQRRVQPRETGPGGEIRFFDQVNPYPGFLTKEGRLPRGYADGGEVESQLQSSNLVPGMSSNLAGRQYIVNDLGKWVPYTAAGDQGAGLAQASSAPPSATPAPRSPAGAMVLGGLGALPAGQNAQRQMGLGTALAAMVPRATSAFQTSPGPITASRTYPGGSPSERIRRNIVGGADLGRREADFGFAKSSSPTSSVGTMGNMDPYGVLARMGSLGLPGLGAATNYSDMLHEYDLTRDSQNRALPFAKGGEVNMEDGSFVVDARTVSELGNGSSNAGIDRLSRMGGQPVRGDGDGVSDSVPARIGGTQEARVARDEVIFSPRAVAKLGGGDHAKGTQKLYAMMEKAHKARKQAKRGQDTKVAKGLGALS